MWLILFLLLFPAGLYAQVIDPVVDVVPADGTEKTLPAGKTGFTPVAISKADNFVLVTLSREKMADPKQTFVITCLTSPDGNTWFPTIKASYVGGEITGEDGKPVAFASLKCPARGAFVSSTVDTVNPITTTALQEKNGEIPKADSGSIPVTP